MAYGFTDDCAKLVFEFKNSQPIELADLTRSLTGVANQYRRFVIREQLHGESEAKLFVKEVRSGSTIVELFSYIAAHHDEIAATIKTSESVVGFGVYLKDALTKLSGGKKPDADIGAKDYSDLSKILETTAKDPQGFLHVHADNGATVNMSFTFNNGEVNAIQNQAERMLEQIKSTDQREFFKREFYWDTAAKGEPRTTDKGIVESIENAPHPVIFDDQAIKEKMLSVAHIFETTYVVDVELIMAKGKTKAYRITKLRDIIEDD